VMMTFRRAWAAETDLPLILVGILPQPGAAFPELGSSR
jgi:hypothetical protein